MAATKGGSQWWAEPFFWLYHCGQPQWPSIDTIISSSNTHTSHFLPLPLCNLLRLGCLGLSVIASMFLFVSMEWKEIGTLKELLDWNIDHRVEKRPPLYDFILKEYSDYNIKENYGWELWVWSLTGGTFPQENKIRTMGCIQCFLCFLCFIFTRTVQTAATSMRSIVTMIASDFICDHHRVARMHRAPMHHFFLVTFIFWRRLFVVAVPQKLVRVNSTLS